MEFVEIFSQMGWIAATLICVGMLFCVIEIFVPGFGFFGISGIFLIVAGAIVRIFNGLNATQSLMLILILLGFVALVIFILIFTAKNGYLRWTGLFETKPSIATNYNQATRELRKLVGKFGKTVTDLNLGGKAKIKGKIYNVLSINSFIPTGKNIKVIEIKDNQIMVRKFFE